MATMRRNWPAIALAAACAAATGYIVLLGARLTFYNDDWYVLLQRPGVSAHSLLEPHNGHLTLIPVTIYKALVAAFGLDSQIPFRLVAAAVVVALALVVFLYVRERLGPAIAVVAAALLLFLGPAWQDLLWTFEIGLMGSLAAGIGAILALERRTPRWDLVGCALLILSIAFSNLGVSFILAAAVEVLLRRAPRKAWIPLLPAVLFAAWWLGYGHDAPSYWSFGHVARLPTYVLDSAAAGLSALAGLSVTPDGIDDPLAWGRPLLVLALVGCGFWCRRRGRPSSQLLVVGVAALSFWALTGLNYAEWRNPFESRYLIISGAFLIMLAAEMFRTARPRPVTVGVIVAVGVIAVGANLDRLKRGYDFFHDQTVLTKADLGALDIARGNVAAGFIIPSRADSPGGRVYLRGVVAGDYFRERDAHGSPAYSEQQIAAAPLAARQAADAVFGWAYGLHLEPAPQSALPARGCRRLGAAFNGGTSEVPLPAGGARIANLGQAPAQIGLRRFATSDPPSFDLGALAGRSAAVVRIPMDSARQAWYLAVGGAPVSICPL